MPFFRLHTLGNLNDPELCRTDGPPQGLGLRSYCMACGDKATAFYPKEPKIALKEKFPGIKLTSLLGNGNSYLIVSSAMKDIIAAHCQDIEVEYLPFDLYDHRQRLYSRDYFIINPIGTRDCLDPGASKVKYGPQGSVIHVGRYVVDSKKAEVLPHLFRPAEERTSYIVSAALAAQLREKGFTNVLLEPLTTAAPT